MKENIKKKIPEIQWNGMGIYIPSVLNDDGEMHKKECVYKETMKRNNERRER